MKRVWNRNFRDHISVAETHEEHLAVTYPSLEPELERLRSLPVPASFKLEPGKVTGRRLERAGVQNAWCLMCGAQIPATAHYCPECDPKSAGEG